MDGVLVGIFIVSVEGVGEDALGLGILTAEGDVHLYVTRGETVVDIDGLEGLGLAVILGVLSDVNGSVGVDDGIEVLGVLADAEEDVLAGASASQVTSGVAETGLVGHGSAGGKVGVASDGLRLLTRQEFLFGVTRGGSSDILEFALNVN